jgi:hypothetical protein
MCHLTPAGMEPSRAARPGLPHDQRSTSATALPGSARAVTPDGTTRNRTSAGANAATARIAHSSPAADSKTFFRPGASDSPRASRRPRSRHRLVVPGVAGGSDTLVPDGTADHLRSPDNAGWPRVATNGEPRQYIPSRNTDSAAPPGQTPAHSPSANSAEREDDENRGLVLPVVDRDAGCGPRERLTPERSSLAEKLVTSPRGDSIPASSLRNAPRSTIIPRPSPRLLHQPHPANILSRCGPLWPRQTGPAQAAADSSPTSTRRSAPRKAPTRR